MVSSSLVETIVGLRRPDTGQVILDGTEITGQHIADVRERGVAYVPEDRHDRGLVLDMTLWENSVLGRTNDKRYASAGGFLLLRKIKDLATRIVKRFDVRTRGINSTAASLSGGNQQKLILGREFEDEPRLLDRSSADAWSGRRRDRIRLASDPRPEGGRARGVARFRRAR